MQPGSEMLQCKSCENQSKKKLALVDQDVRDNSQRLSSGIHLQAEDDLYSIVKSPFSIKKARIAINLNDAYLKRNDLNPKTLKKKDTPGIYKSSLKREK